ncbi:ThuA domain-containing protein [Akkermansiaceae bacterium]|nr:ThuA domain-containing protein [Akkermansiaceae bacterium]
MKTKPFFTLLLALIGVLGLTLWAAEKEEANKKPKHIAFLVGDDLNHASGTHEFYAGGMLLQQSLANSNIKDQITSTVVNNWPEDTSVFDKADVIVHYYKGNKWHFMNENHALIDKLAEKGLGQLFIHFAVDPEKEAEPFIKKWTGAVYKTGLSSNPHWNLKATLEKHPINSGVLEVDLRDEWYVKMDYEQDCAIDYNGNLETGKVHAIMTGKPSAMKGNKKLTRALAKNKKPSDLTVFWAKESDTGSRGAGLTGAHFHKNWAHDAFRKQVLNAIAWCAHLPVPQEGVTSPQITEDMLNENLDKRKPKFGRLKKHPSNPVPK